MEYCNNCKQRSITFVCTSCRFFLCKECIDKHSNIGCQFDELQNYFLRLLCVKEENLEDHLNAVETIKEKKKEYKEKLKCTSLKQDIKNKITEEVKNMENYIKLIDGMEKRLKDLEKEIKSDKTIKEPITLLGEFTKLDDNIPPFNFNKEVKEILKKNNKLSEEANKMKELLEDFERKKKMYANEEEEHKRTMTERRNQQVELNKKNKELEEENKRLYDANMKLKKTKVEPDEIVKNAQDNKERLINEFTSKQNELRSLKEQIAKMNEEKTKIDEQYKKKLSELNIATGKLDNIEFEMAKQSTEKEKLEKECSEKRKEIERLNLEEMKAKKSLNDIENKKKKSIEESNRFRGTLKGSKEKIESYRKGIDQGTRNESGNKEKQQLIEQINNLKTRLKIQSDIFYYRLKSMKVNGKEMKELIRKINDSFNVYKDTFSTHKIKIVERIKAQKEEITNAIEKIEILCNNLIKKLNPEDLLNENSAKYLCLKGRNMSALYKFIENVIRIMPDAYSKAKHEKETEELKGSPNKSEVDGVVKGYENQPKTLIDNKSKSQLKTAKSLPPSSNSPIEAKKEISPNKPKMPVVQSVSTKDKNKEEIKKTQNTGNKTYNSPKPKSGKLKQKEEKKTIDKKEAKIDNLVGLGYQKLKKSNEEIKDNTYKGKSNT